MKIRAKLLTPLILFAELVAIVSLHADDERVEKTQPNIFSADETADVGLDN